MHDLLIKSGRVFDGTGEAPRHAETAALYGLSDRGLIVSDHSYSRDSAGAAENDPRNNAD